MFISEAGQVGSAPAGAAGQWILAEGMAGGKPPGSIIVRSVA